MARIRSAKPELPAHIAAEIRGFFFGEGHLDLSKSATNSFTPRARVALREDDVLVLEWLRSRLGGSIGRRVATRSYCWQLTGRPAMAVLLGILADGQIPSKKRREVVLLQEALALVPDSGHHISNDAACRLAQIRAELKGARAFAGVI